MIAMNTKLLKQKILDLAIRGKLVPQDPNDEPASVLLERIKAEKERLIAEGKIKRSKKSTQSSDKLHYENMPKGWTYCRFDELCTTFSTGPFGSMVHKSDYVTTDGIPLVNPANIVNGEIRTEKLMMVNRVKAKELDRYKLSFGDILLARRGDLSKCAIISEREENWLYGTGSFVLHIPFVLPRYIEFYYSSEYVQTILSHECVGATMDNLNQSVLGQLSFLLPPLAEQHTIVAAIEHCFTLVESIEKEKNDLQSVIQQTKTKVLDLAIRGKLVPQDPADEPATELLKRINPNAEPCDTSHYENLPHGWAVCRLEDIVNYEQPTQYIVQSTKYSDDYSTPVLTAGKSFILGYTNEEKNIYQQLPAIIFDDFTTDSKLVDFPFKVKSSAMKILQVTKGINIYYVAYFMSITRLIGDTHKRYWISEYSKTPIPIPPINEQGKIVKAIKDIEEKLLTITAEL